jgi:hypothetical protein
MKTKTERAAGPVSRGRWLAGALAILFGLATLAAGGQALFGGPAARAQAGDVVGFVLVFNFCAGFVYVLTGGATLLRQRWAVWLARGLAAGTLLIFAAFLVHVLQGGAFERRTLVAMSVRSLFWIVQALALPRLLR